VRNGIRSPTGPHFLPLKTPFAWGVHRAAFARCASSIHKKKTHPHAMNTTATNYEIHPHHLRNRKHWRSGTTVFTLT
jgi:hypothetical protein